MITLNQGQENVVKAAVDWFRHSDRQTFEFDGEAGTGKSVTLHAILDELRLNCVEYMPMAFTGAASVVMRLRGFPTAKSIHSSLYKVEKVPANSDNPFFNVNTFNDTRRYVDMFVPKTKEEIDPRVKLFVIDEGYMVPDFMRKEIEKYGRKIIVAGDSGQLPPVNGSPAYLTGPNVYHLTELMRQSIDNPIVYLAHRARRGLPIDCGLYGNRALVIEEQYLTNEMVLNVGNIVCGTNRTRDAFNRRIRELLGYTTDLPMFGERVICRNNNWSIEEDGIALCNGLSGHVVSNYNVSNFKNNRYIIDFLPDLLNIPFRNLELDYKYFTANTEIRKEMKSMNSKKYAFGEFFEFAYAITTHLAQGQEFPSGIVYEEYLRSDIQNQLMYTAITRMKEYLILVKRPRRIYR